MKIIRYVIVVSMIGIILSFLSCEKDTGYYEKKKVEAVSFSQDESMKIFANIFSKALYDKDIRAFVRSEALKQVDNDYDVIYHYVKDQLLSNGETFHERLTKYCNNQIEFENMINSNKLLTIYIPCLENFSAWNWDVNVTVPSVAVRLEDSNGNYYAINKDGVFGLNSKERPKIPVLVIKQNERLTDSLASTKSLVKNELSNRNGVFAYFIDESFDTRVKTKFSLDDVYSYYVYSDNELLKKAFALNMECPRDFIYYGISSTENISKGKLKTEYREYITSIEFVDPANLSHVDDPFDPTGDWADGNLEICFDFIFVDRSEKPLNTQKMKSVSIDKLFDKPNAPTRTLEYVFPEPVEVFNWDLYSYGNTYKVSVSEYDPGTVIEKQESHSSVFGSNFGGEGGLDIGIIKIGGKYNETNTETKQSSVKIQSTNNTDPLGDVLVNFFDPIYIKNKLYVESFYVKPGINQPIAREYNYFNSGEELRIFMNKFKLDSEKYFEEGHIRCYHFDRTAYENIKVSNTGMIKLNIQPRSLY